MVCAMALSFSAVAKGLSKLYFNRNQFQPSHTTTTQFNGYPALTFPLVYTGSVKFDGWLANSNESVCVVEEKFTPSLYMTICQPCIDCFTCVPIPTSDEGAPAEITEPAAGPLPITAWNLYFVVNYKVGKVKKTYIRKVDLIAADAIFYTGPAGNKPGLVQALSEKAFLTLGGKKSDYTFEYYNAVFGDDAGGTAWEEVIGGKKQKGYIKSFAELKGNLTVADKMDDGVGYQLNGEFSLKRDNALTKMAVNAIFGTEKHSGKDWENCGGDASYCEEYFINGDYDSFDAYLEDKYGKTLDDNNIELGETLDDLYEAIYFAVYDEELPTGI